jgi:hypothetical protein
VQIDISRDPGHMEFYLETGPTQVAGTQITFFVPFEGDPDLFRCQPSVHQLYGPRARIEGSELSLMYQTTDHNAEPIKAEFNVSWSTSSRRPSAYVRR